MLGPVVAPNAPGVSDGPRPSGAPAGLRAGGRGGAPARPRVGAERGAVTAELAILLPAVVLLLLVCGVLGAAVLGQIRCADAARAGARAAAIGESHEQVVAVAQQLAGDDAEVLVSRDGAWVEVRVARPVAGELVGLGALQASATARAWVEPGGPGG